MPNKSAHHALLPTPMPKKSRLRGYYELTRLHKPVLGNSLMFWPCGRLLLPKHHRSELIGVLAWGLTMAAYAVGTPLRDLGIQLLLFGIGSTLLHSAACVLNDICDIDFDRLVGEPFGDEYAYDPTTLTLWPRTHAVAAAARRGGDSPRGMGAPRPAHHPDYGDAASDEPDGVSASPSFFSAAIPVR